MESSKVAIVGDSFCDLLASVGTLPVWGSDVVTSRPLEMVPGGSALNTAVQLDNMCRVFDAFPASSVPRQAGPPSVVLHSVVGRDSFGNFLRRALQKTGVYLSSPSDKSVREVRQHYLWKGMYVGSLTACFFWGGFW